MLINATFLEKEDIVLEFSFIKFRTTAGQELECFHDCPDVPPEPVISKLSVT